MHMNEFLTACLRKLTFYKETVLEVNEMAKHGLKITSCHNSIGEME